MLEQLEALGPEFALGVLAGITVAFVSRYLVPLVMQHRSMSDSLEVKHRDLFVESIAIDRGAQNFSSIVNSYLRDEDFVRAALERLDFEVQEQARGPDSRCDFLATRENESVAVEVKSNFSTSSRFLREVRHWLAQTSGSDLPDKRLLVVFDHSGREAGALSTLLDDNSRWDIRVLKAPQEYTPQDEDLETLKSSITEELGSWLKAKEGESS
jgi:hypothetical protein